MMQCPNSGLILPSKFIDEKEALKKVVDEVVDEAVYANQGKKGTYYLTLHMKFNKMDSSQFDITPPIVSDKLPPFLSNTLVFWVNNTKGICELLWMVSKKSGKLKIDFNNTGVAYLQAKGAMPS